ncbi:MarR family winged helix-turn-helix transcriptional regulator [Streptomyces yaanensis]|uniref:MarR family winged helix-turn-helix transcriptional regulator n=1 Tax=Streptomyces yaanensis TaxID=1142239 RepID=A0ABV7SIT6_9ACTN|nr:MarR family transcriptional regulator [Streptomyces sp. CGMCC 4.7035]WNC01255.1 MarR family transcriptional regulator [Streptomyces sp. CGMCC 4.7035]
MSSSETDGTRGSKVAGEAAADERRVRTLEQLMTVGRQHSAVTVMFHSAIAAKQGLSATEEKTLDFLERRGPLTAKDLAELTGLAPASVTGLIDRMENKGFVYRVKHPTDKRRVLVELNREKIGELAGFFDDWVRDVVEACQEFSTDELETVVRFLAVMSERQRKAAARLSE